MHSRREDSSSQVSSNQCLSNQGFFELMTDLLITDYSARSLAVAAIFAIYYLLF